MSQPGDDRQPVWNHTWLRGHPFTWPDQAVELPDPNCVSTRGLLQMSRILGSMEAVHGLRLSFRRTEVIRWLRHREESLR